MTKIDDAVNNSFLDITKLQVAQRLLHHVVRVLNDAQSYGTKKEVERAAGILMLEINDELVKAWDSLAYFGTVDMRAKQAMHERAKSWFAKQDAEIMSWLGEEGQYWKTGEKEFKKELSDAFGFDLEDDK